MLRNIILLVKDPIASSSFFKQAVGLSIKHQTDHMVELMNSNGKESIPIILKSSGIYASQLCTGYSPILTFDVDDMDHTIQTALSMGAILDGPIKYPAQGKFASIKSPDGHIIGLYEPTR